MTKYANTVEVRARTDVGGDAVVGYFHPNELKGVVASMQGENFYDLEDGEIADPQTQWVREDGRWFYEILWLT